MTKTWFRTLLVAAAVLGAAPAAAQDFPLALEMRLDGGIPVQDTDDLLDTGIGLGLRVSLDIAPNFAVYGGWSRFEFDYDEDIFDDEEFVENGFELGGRVGLGYGHGSAMPYAMLGALFHEDETGLEAGIGADYPVSWNVSVTPEIRYRTIDDVDYLALGFGARFRF